MLLPKITEDVKRAMFLGPLYKSISSAFPRSLFAAAWIFVSDGGEYSDRTAGARIGIFGAYDGTGGSRFEGLAVRKGVVWVKDLTWVALLRSSLRSGCEDIVFFFESRTERIAEVVSTGRNERWRSSG
jgi:hypothetical protein